MSSFAFVRVSAILMALVVLNSCGNRAKPQWLMPTPAMYLSGELKPFEHLGSEMRSTETEVFFATNRKHGDAGYGAGLADDLRFGVATMRLGEEDETWSSLVEASTTHPRPQAMEVSVVDSREMAAFGSPGVDAWARQIDRSIASTPTRDVVVYVHGAKVGFEHSCAFAAELKHFSGRDLTAVAFDWPTHREIFSYLDRVDVRHAQKSATDLVKLIQVLSSKTRARRIHVVSWSAGARVLSRAMDQLAGVPAKPRLGAVVFAAGDVPEKDFRKRLPAIHGLSERVIVYVSDDDFALRWSSRLMGGGRRLGTEWKSFGPKELAYLEAHPRLEIVDTSYGKEQRGFDIRGHRYWFQHPWVNSDLLLALRTDEDALSRGLSQGRSKGLYYFAEEYDKRIGKVGKSLTGGTW